MTLGLSLVAGRYAKALFSLAKEKNVLDQVADDLKKLKELFSQSEELRLFAVDTLLSRPQQAEVMKKVVSSLNLHDLVIRLLGVLAERRRMGAFEDVAQSFLGLMAKEKNIVPVTIVGATTFSDQQQKTVTTLLEQSLQRKITAEWEIDPSIIGGMLVKIGSTLYDCSLAGKLQRVEALGHEAIAA
ncbi:MAG: ATP synthase F1 subunit delta [Alphaproteobacteria bacterium]|nr:ATP synthase F1 subunit delta [Alphaproteobacteria bacterium]